MRSFTAFSLLGFASIAAAHFQLQFPGPRGPFVEDDEPKFCDGFDNPATNRTQFPLSGGFYALNSEHPTWTVFTLLSNSSNPTKFSDFEQVTPFAQLNGEGVFCLPLDFSTSQNASSMGLKAGDNVTIQIEFVADDGRLFQCADLTLSDSVDIASAFSCTNASQQAGSGSGSSGSSGNSSDSGNSSSSGGGDSGATIETPSLKLAISLLGALGLALVFV
ncbi:hypothetical protein D9758_002371 [Tetrapyrgos nigripes]|uniref:Copper acquisition factor BIM1-like domain-containing protein n=1 Tax=Tetrapyrgos nigripes TaxID=182062 RepID=A0A8H5LSJ1_9AGAR|nr:hypothetical protein D9758_002371 [Tetrapyrgos nigripes]